MTTGRRSSSLAIDGSVPAPVTDESGRVDGLPAAVRSSGGSASGEGDVEDHSIRLPGGEHRSRLEEDLQERLAFESVLSDLAQRFLEAQPEGFRDAVSIAICEVGQHLRADRLGMFEFSEDLCHGAFTHEYCASGVSRRLGARHPHAEGMFLRKEGLPWSWFVAGRGLIYHNLDELQETPEIQALYADQGAHSLLQLPLTNGDQVLGFLFMEAVDRPRNWTEREVRKFEILAHLFSTALWRNRMENNLKFRAELEELVARSSNRFLNSSIDEFDRNIAATLADLGEITQADRCFHFEFSDNHRYARERHEWLRPGMAPHRHMHQAMPTSAFGWLMERLQRGEVVHVSHVDLLPSESGVLRSQLKSLDTVAVVLIPIFVQDRLDGFLGFSSMSTPFAWPSERVALLSVVAGSVAAAMERWSLERSLQARREELVAASRLAMLGEMVAGIAHEVKQPLHAIRNYTSAIHHALEEGPDDPEQVRTWSARARDLVDRTDAIINRYRDFSRPTLHPWRTTTLNAILYDAGELVTGELERHNVTIVRINGDAEAGEIPLYCDPVQLMQVVVNLLLNAIDAMRDIPRPRRVIEVEVDRSETELAIHVRDHGVGIPAGLRSKIFDPFYSTKPQGLGLGLAVSRRIMAEHQGTLDCLPADPGTRFRIGMPLVENLTHEV